MKDETNWLETNSSRLLGECSQDSTARRSGTRRLASALLNQRQQAQPQPPHRLGLGRGQRPGIQRACRSGRYRLWTRFHNCFIANRTIFATGAH
jgi:hypothetical protein